METEKLAQTFVSLADTLVDDFDVFDLLQTLTSRCQELLGAAATGLLLADSAGHLQVAAATHESAELLDLFQLQNDEGPCLDCFRSGTPVREQKLDSAMSRWPGFAPAAIRLGFTSVLALPLRLRGQVIGALNVFGGSNGAPIGEDDLPVAQCLADAATIAILQERLVRDRNVMTEQLQIALDSRVVIEQAKGALASRLDIETGEAFELLRRRSRNTRRRLVDLAEEVVNDGIDSDWDALRQDTATNPIPPSST
ncbi:MAG: GAF and ANTAR domain-containing protein [Nocardioidaceae bacterium]